GAVVTVALIERARPGVEADAVLRRITHVAERVAGDAGRVDLLADQEGVRAGAAVVVRLGRRAEDVGEVLVERGRLVEPVEVGLAAGPAVGPLVRDDVERAQLRET